MNREKTTYLLMGFSVASWFACRAIREEDRTGRILGVSDEGKAYSRPLISYALGQAGQGITYYGDVLQKAEIDLLWEQRVESLDGENRIARLSDGRAIEFEKGLIATGGVPVIPPVAGLKTEGVFTFTRAQDLEDIDQYLRKYRVNSAVILGGGFIGLKTAEALMELDLDLSIVELAPRLLVNMIDDQGSVLLEKALRTHEVNVVLEDTIERIESDTGRVSGVVLRSGRRIPTSLVVIAVGVRPNVEWLGHSGVAINRGVVVDSNQGTSVPGVYAAGDVAETVNMLTGERGVTAVWPEAVAQGKVAGWNMAGRIERYPGSLPVNAVEVGQQPLISAGTVNPDGEEYRTMVRQQGAIYQKLVIRENRLVGLIFVGDIEKAGIYINLIREQVPIDSFQDKLLDPNFGIISLPSNFRKHMVEGAGIEV